MALISAAVASSPVLWQLAMSPAARRTGLGAAVAVALAATVGLGAVVAEAAGAAVSVALGAVVAVALAAWTVAVGGMSVAAGANGAPAVGVPAHAPASTATACTRQNIKPRLPFNLIF